MRTLSVTLVLAAFPAAAAATVPSNRVIALELGVAAPAGAGVPAQRLVALSAATWLEGPLEVVATVAWADGGDRGSAVRGSAGLRAVAGRRWLGSLHADVGWTTGGHGGAGATFGAGAGVGQRAGAFVVRVGSGLRAGPGGPRLELVAGVEARY